MKDSQNTPDSRLPARPRELIEEFAAADRDNDGRVDFEEFKSLLDGLNAGMSERELQIGFREVDSDADGLIDCREFVEWWAAD